MFKALLLSALVGGGVYLFTGVNWDYYATRSSLGDIDFSAATAVRGISNSVGGIASNAATALTGN